MKRTLQVGDWVHHKNLGVGIVNGCRSLRGDTAVSVLFRWHGERRFLLSLCTLEVIPREEGRARWAA